MRKSILLGLFLIPLLILAFASLHVRFSTDDYCVASRAHDAGIPNGIILAYQDTNGRFAYHLVSQPAILLPYVGLPALVTLIVWSIAIWDIGRLLKMPPELALAVLLCILSTTRNLTQVLYWQSGLFVYGFPLMLFCVLVDLILRKTPPTICAFVAFLIAGFSDTIAVAQIAFWGLLVLWDALSKTSPVRPLRRQIWFALFGACVGFLLVFFAPDTAHRLARQPATDWGQALSLAATYFLVMPMATLILQKPLILLLILIIPWSLAPFEANSHRQQQLKLWLLLSLIGLFVINFLCFLLGFAATSLMLPERAQSIPMMFTIVTLAFLSYVAGSVIPKRIPKALPVTLILALIGLSTIYAVDLAGKMQRYAQLADERDRQIRAGVTQVAAIYSDYAPDGDLGDADAGAYKLWINGCMASYYRVERIEQK